MSFFNEAQRNASLTEAPICPKCGERMEFEDENKDTLVCLHCGHDEDSGHHGLTDDKYENSYPTKEEGYGDDAEDEEDEYNGESYDEACGELRDG